MKRSDLTPQEFDPYFDRYLQKVPADTMLMKGLDDGYKTVASFFEKIPVEKHNYYYADGKWSIKEILQHIIDCERVFIYRCFRIARNDKTSLAGFDQNIYIEPSGARLKSMRDLMDEYRVCRQNSISILGSLSKEDLMRIGTANDGPMSARAAAFTILGHEQWHLDVISERYF